MAPNQKPVSFRFAGETKEMLARLTAYKRGRNQTAMMEELIRDAFRLHEKEIERYEKKRGKKK